MSADCTRRLSIVSIELRLNDLPDLDEVHARPSLIRSHMSSLGAIHVVARIVL